MSLPEKSRDSSRNRFLGPSDVDMSLEPSVYQKVQLLGSYAETDETMIHYTVTEACPFRCHGCINALTAGMGDPDRTTYVPQIRQNEDLERDIRGMCRLIEASGKGRVVIVFYGGEPMLELDKMNHVFETLGRLLNGRVRTEFMVITSGHYLERMVKRYPVLASNIALTGLSIDGRQVQHDSIRRGTSLREIRRQSEIFNKHRTGDVLVWSTMRPGMSLFDCYRSFMYLRERGEAEHFFWHWDEASGVIPCLEEYMEAYRRDLEAIMEEYVDSLARGSLLSIVHVNELILYLLTKRSRGTSACGVENMGDFDIIGDGKVHGCADLPEAMSIGRITDSGEVVFKPGAGQQLAGVISYKNDLGCYACGVEPYCGGRCPVLANTGGIERAKQYCYLMRDHVKTIKGYTARIAELMAERGIGLAELYASARLAHYADVTP